MAIPKRGLSEKRGAPRAPGILTGGWSGSATPSRIASLSVTGCFVESKVLPNKDERVRVDIELPEGARVSLRAEVVYLEPTMGFALRFLEVSSDVLDKLTSAVEYLRAESR